MGDARERGEAAGGGLLLGGGLRREGEEAAAVTQATGVEDGADAADEALGAEAGDEAEQGVLRRAEVGGEGGQGALDEGPGALQGVEPVGFLGGQSHGAVGSVSSWMSGSPCSPTSAGIGSRPRARRSERVARRASSVARSLSGSW